MNARRPDLAPPAPEAPSAPKPTKPLTPMAEALKLQGALDKLAKREAEWLANGKARYQAERDELLGAASEKAKRILEAAAEEGTRE